MRRTWSIYSKINLGKHTKISLNSGYKVLILYGIFYHHFFDGAIKHLQPSTLIVLAIQSFAFARAPKQSKILLQSSTLLKPTKDVKDRF
jgi:hypothetical protein